MFKDFIKQEIGIEILPLVSLCFFVIFFTALIIRVIMYSKTQIQELSNLPLEDSDKSEFLKTLK